MVLVGTLQDVERTFNFYISYIFVPFVLLGIGFHLRRLVGLSSLMDI